MLLSVRAGAAQLSSEQHLGTAVSRQTLKPGTEMPNKWNIQKFILLSLHLRWYQNLSPAHLLPWSSLIHPHSWEELKPSPCAWNQGKSVKSAKPSGITRRGTAPHRSILIHRWNSGLFFPWLPKALCSEWNLQLTALKGVTTQKFTPGSYRCHLHPGVTSRSQTTRGCQGCRTSGQEKPGTSPGVFPKVFAPGPGWPWLQC